MIYTCNHKQTVNVEDTPHTSCIDYQYSFEIYINNSIAIQLPVSAERSVPHKS